MKYGAASWLEFSTALYRAIGLEPKDVKSLHFDIEAGTPLLEVEAHLFVKDARAVHEVTKRFRYQIVELETIEETITRLDGVIANVRRFVA
jgi:hypothetical protein